MSFFYYSNLHKESRRILSALMILVAGQLYFHEGQVTSQAARLTPLYLVCVGQHRMHQEVSLNPRTLLCVTVS